MRRIAVLILCLLLPLQGFAASRFVAQPCPMQAMMTKDDAVGDLAQALAEAMKNCCNDIATLERTGQPCKSAEGCTVAVAWTPPLQPVAFMALATQVVRAPVWRGLPPGAHSRLWRPPTSV